MRNRYRVDVVRTSKLVEETSLWLRAESAEAAQGLAQRWISRPDELVGWSETGKETQLHRFHVVRLKVEAVPDA